MMMLKQVQLFACATLLLLASTCDGADYAIPCVFGENKPAGCSQRIKPCSAFSAAERAGANVILPDTNYRCSSTSPKMRDTVFAGPSTNTYFVQFDDRNGNCYGIVMQAGECWGEQPNTGSDYDCQGKCGPGCTNGQANWGRDCLKHDVCSFYFGASGGGSHPDCGDSFGQASNDYLSFGSGCKTNGNSCLAPTPQPTTRAPTPFPTRSTPAPAPTQGSNGGGSGTGGACEDVGGLTFSDGRPAPCDTITSYCSSYAVVRERCQRSCGACPDSTDSGSNAGCSDVGGLTYSNGNPAPCNEIGQYCSQYSFVREACQKTCGECSSSRAASAVIVSEDEPLPAPESAIDLVVVGGAAGALIVVAAVAATVIVRRRRSQSASEAVVKRDTAAVSVSSENPAHLDI